MTILQAAQTAGRADPKASVTRAEECAETG